MYFIFACQHNSYMDENLSRIMNSVLVRPLWLHILNIDKLQQYSVSFTLHDLRVTRNLLFSSLLFSSLQLIVIVP
jgi:hypothetical protein